MDRNIEPSLVRVNIRMGEDLKSWYENIAKENGIPYSAYMVFALMEYKKQNEAVNIGKSAFDLKDLIGSIPVKKL